MRRGQVVAAGTGVSAVVLLGAGLWTFREEISAWRRSLVVRQLLDPQKRNAAWREVVGWQRYADGGPRDRITLDHGEEVREVVLCPQLRGKPLLAVFSARWSGRFWLVRMDGTLLPDGPGFSEIPLCDINGDSVLDGMETQAVDFVSERLDSNSFQPFETLYGAAVLLVVPITESHESTLMVAYERIDAAGLKWRLQESNRPGLFDVVLEESGEGIAPDSVQAVYRWSKNAGKYVGPAGSADGDFLRIDLDPEDHWTGPIAPTVLRRIKEFAAKGFTD